MALHRLSLRLRPTATHVRSFYTSRVGQQQNTVAAEPETEPFSVFRTKEDDPAFHSEKHIGQYYNVPSSHIQTLFHHGLPWRYKQQVETFNEASFMVRQPALEVISDLKQLDPSKPVQRYIFYGLKGSGKTISMCHTLHYCYTQGWLVLHVPDAHIWVKNCKELLPSSYKSSRFDQPFEAAEWLHKFKITNERFLSKIKTKHRYIWTKREVTEEGRPLGELVDQGTTRVRSSSDVIGALMKELRLQSGQPGSDFKLVAAVDGVNALWGRTTLKKRDSSIVDLEELTLIYNLRKLMRNDWIGGAVITTLSQTGSLFTPISAYWPQDMLGEIGFDSMDPFIPISVPNYSEKEFESCYLYYLDRNWLQHPQSRTEEGKKEILFLCNRNPWTMEKMCCVL